jgi:NAD(P)-dependent dehydrogenase (short-subunit alcohol dehydrogenase family)
MTLSRPQYPAAFRGTLDRHPTTRSDPMELELEGKVAVITGAGKGIGLATVRALVREGALVVAGSRSATPELTALSEESGVHVELLDLASATGAGVLVDAAIAKHGRIDVLVNNLGATKPRGGFLNVSDEDWQRSIEVNFFSAVRACRAALPRLLDGGGVIVNIGSINARLPFPDVVDYSAGKAALTNLAKALSEEFAPQGVRVNTIAPGPVRTPLWMGPGGFAEQAGAAAGISPEEAVATIVPRSMGISTGRITEPEEVADLVVFLASARAANITGAEFTLDGGHIKTT